jgi:hypothetical protein
MGMRLWGTAAGVLLLAGGVAASELVNVKLREATVRSGPKPFKTAVGTAKFGDRLEVTGKQEGWLEVKLPDGKTGFLHESATTDKPLTKTAAGGGTSGGGSRDETAMAGKGFRKMGGGSAEDAALADSPFGPKGEKAYRTKHPEVEPKYAQVDGIEKRSVQAAELEKFLSEGKLGGGAQ